MGDRVSIRFTNKYETAAPVVFSHWGGLSFVEAAINYAKDLIDENKKLNKKSLSPLDRLETGTVTCDFLYNIDKYYYIGSSTDAHHIDGDIYIGKDENDGDNSDNGHFDIELDNDSLVKLWARITT